MVGCLELYMELYGIIWNYRSVGIKLRGTCCFRAIEFREKTWQVRIVRPSPRYFLEEG